MSQYPNDPSQTDKAKGLIRAAIQSGAIDYADLLAGRYIVDLLADNTDWDLETCARVRDDIIHETLEND